VAQGDSYFNEQIQEPLPGLITYIVLNLRSVNGQTHHFGFQFFNFKLYFHVKLITIVDRKGGGLQCTKDLDKKEIKFFLSMFFYSRQTGYPHKYCLFAVLSCCDQ